MLILDAILLAVNLLLTVSELPKTTPQSPPSMNAPLDVPQTAQDVE